MPYPVDGLITLDNFQRPRFVFLVDSLTHYDFAAGQERKACDEAVSRYAGSAIGSPQCLRSHSQSISSTRASLSASISFYRLDVWLPSDPADELRSESDRLQISIECNGKSVYITRDEARMRFVCMEQVVLDAKAMRINHGMAAHTSTTSDLAS